MKTAGFSASHDRTIIEEEYWYTDGDRFVDSLTSEEIKRVANYLQSGTMVFSMTLALFDKENYIGSYCIYTDGEWLWPSHLAYYVMQGRFGNLSTAFRDHIMSKNTLAVTLSAEEKQKSCIFVERFLIKIGKRA